MPKRIEHKSGEIVGECIFLSELPSIRKTNGAPQRMGRFKCLKCGSEFDAVVWAIRKKKTRSCGCLNGKKPNHKPQRHGLRNSPLYNKWAGIKRRCFDRTYPAYPDYGGRGIILCDEWVRDFRAFHDYMTKLPHYGEPGRSIDRYPNKNGDYEPGNVRWATSYEQNVNQRIQKNNTTGFIGVFRSDGKYRSAISVNGVRHHFKGSYVTPREAAMIRDEFIIENNLINHPLNILTFTK